MKDDAIPAARALVFEDLVALTEKGIASRILAKTKGRNMTLFAFDQGQELSEHSAPFDALVMVLKGELKLVIDGQAVRAIPGTIVRMPANIAHAVFAVQASHMLLIMLRDLP